MITQTVVGFGTEERVYWVETNHREGVRINKGDQVILAEEGTETFWSVRQVLGEYADNVQLPPKSRVGTILHHIRATT